LIAGCKAIPNSAAVFIAASSGGEDAALADGCAVRLTSAFAACRLSSPWIEAITLWKRAGICGSPVLAKSLALTDTKLVWRALSISATGPVTRMKRAFGFASTAVKPSPQSQSVTASKSAGLGPNCTLNCSGVSQW